MKRVITIVLSLLILLTISACGSSQTAYTRASLETKAHMPSESASESIQEAGSRVEIASLKGSICVPDGYYALSEDLPYTDEMLKSISINKQNLEEVLPLLQGQTIIVPAGKPYADSLHYYIKVKEKKYENITLSNLSQSDYDFVASSVVSSFNVDQYETVTGNGLRFFVFNYNVGLGNTYRYATILNGHMIYIYVNTGDKTITKDQKNVLESIALSIHHGL